MTYTPTEGEFVFVVRSGYIDFPGKVVTVDTDTRQAMIRPVGQDIDPLPVGFDDIQRHPLSTQRGVSEEG